jgi:hypothetical protein
MLIKIVGKTSYSRDYQDTYAPADIDSLSAIGGVLMDALVEADASKESPLQDPSISSTGISKMIPMPIRWKLSFGLTIKPSMKQ